MSSSLASMASPSTGRKASSARRPILAAIHEQPTEFGTPPPFVIHRADTTVNEDISERFPRTSSTMSYDRTGTILGERTPTFLSDCESSIESISPRRKKSSISSRRSLLMSKSVEYVENWAFLSFASGGGSSWRFGNASTKSLPEIPSYDRHSSGFLMSINLQSMILGTSMLSIPFCAKLAGIYSLPLIFLIGVMTNFTANILFNCQYEDSVFCPGHIKRVRTSFVQMCRDCWNKYGQWVMELLVYLSLIRNVVVLILLTDLFSDILAAFNITEYDKKLLSVMWVLLTLPLMFIKRISILAWVSFIGLILYLLALGCILLVCLLSYQTWDVSVFATNFDVKGVGISIGIIVNSYAVHMNMPALENSLQNPMVYRRTTNVSFILNIIAKLAFCTVGYLSFGDSIQQEITTNIQVYHPLPIIMKAAIMFFSYFTIPLQSFVVFELIDEKFVPAFPICNAGSWVWLLMSRSLIMLACLLISVLIPEFGLVVSLVGSVRGSLIALVLPGLLYLMLSKQKLKLHVKMFAIFVVIFGILGGGLGLYASLSALIEGM